MLPCRLLLFIALILRSSFSQIPYNEIEFRIFIEEKTDIETKLYNSLKKTEQFFARDEIATIFNDTFEIVSFTPFVRQLEDLVKILREMLADKSGWKVAFVKTIVQKTQNEIDLSEIRSMEASLKIIQDRLTLLSETNNDYENRKFIASDIFTKIDDMINTFIHPNSLFKKYPLIGAMPLIQLSMIVATFSPLANTIIPIESDDPAISCKIRDALLEYRLFAVNERIKKLSSDSIFLKPAIVKIELQPYNLYAYNETNSGTIDCVKCDKGHLISDNAACLKDAYSEDDYFSQNFKCWSDYVGLVRHRVEQMFPIKLLDNLCVVGGLIETNSIWKDEVNWGKKYT